MTLLTVVITFATSSAVVVGQACSMEYEAAPLLDGELVGLVRSMEAGPDGQLYTAHPFDGSIRANGAQFWPRVGHQHNGQELRPATLGWLGDTLYAADQSGAYALLFDRRGVVLGRRDFVPPAPGPPFSRTSFLRLLAEGRVLFETTAPVEAVASGRASSFPLLASADGTLTLDTLAWLSRRHVVMRIDLDSTTTTFVRQPFGDGALFTVSADGKRIVVAERDVNASSPNSTYTITAMTAQGDTLFRQDYAYEPIRMRESWKAAAIDQIAAGRRGRPGGNNHEEWLGRIRAAIYFPAWLPPVSRVVLDRNGRVWVRREAVPGNESIRWEALSSNGTREATLEIPASLSVRAADGFVLWATEAAGGRSHRLWRIAVRRC